MRSHTIYRTWNPSACLLFFFSGNPPWRCSNSRSVPSSASNPRDSLLCLISRLLPCARWHLRVRKTKRPPLPPNSKANKSWVCADMLLYQTRWLQMYCAVCHVCIFQRNKPVFWIRNLASISFLFKNELKADEICVDRYAKARRQLLRKSSANWSFLLQIVRRLKQSMTKKKRCALPADCILFESNSVCLCVWSDKLQEYAAALPTSLKRDNWRS